MGQLHRDRPRSKRCLGHSGIAHLHDPRRQRSCAHGGRWGNGGGNVGSGRREKYPRASECRNAGNGYTRTGNSPHGERSEEVGAQCVQPGARREKFVRDGRSELCVVRVPEPDAYHDGGDGPRMRSPDWPFPQKRGLMQTPGSLNQKTALTVLESACSNLVSLLSQREARVNLLKMFVFRNSLRNLPCGSYFLLNSIKSGNFL